MGERDINRYVSLNLFVQALTGVDLPLTDLYETEGTGGFAIHSFKARPVVGGHFAFLALERACGGKAVAGLSFLDDVPARELDIPTGDGRLDGEL